MTYIETAFTFKNDTRNELIGIISTPVHEKARVGLLILVGGPQYRIGSHRQYVHLARHCAAQGISSMRFDYQGIGDSDGQFQGFEHVEIDIYAAIDQFLKRTPDIQTVAIWGLCEGASSILLCAIRHPAISNIILVNPWVRSPQGLAKAYVKHYYWDRLKNPAFLKKLLLGDVNLKAAITGFISNIKKSFGPKMPQTQNCLSHPPLKDILPFPDRMLCALKEFKGKTMLILSENDLVAQEFDDLITTHPEWHKIIAEKVSLRIDIANTDHTFSTEEWSGEVAKNTANWLLSEKY